MDYQEKLRLAKEALDSGSYDKETIEYIFPELKDERIRKEILQLVSISGNGNQFEKIKDWLEKQGGNNKCSQVFTFDDVLALQCAMANAEDSDEKLYHALQSLHDRIHDAYHNEKQGEQKPIDNVEPKFKVGDWITNGACIIQITSIDNKYYWHDGDCVGGDIESIDKDYHLWTIQDAKDGDVLFTSSTASFDTFVFKNIDENNNVKCYFAYDSEDGFREGEYHFIGRAGCKPATKERRNLLFKKMKEAGYEWDSEKKELKKIVENSDWNKEDNEQLVKIVECLNNYGNILPDIEAYKVFRLADWLKSIKETIKEE